MSLKDLEKAVATAKKRVNIQSRRSELERELKVLREGKKTKLARRLSRGFVALTKEGAKATGRGIVKARKFAESTGAGEGLDVELESSLPRRKVVKRIVRRVVRRRAKPKRKLRVVRVTTIRRRIKARPVARRIKRRAVRRVARDDGFGFGLDF